jgi:hypothetical protein
VIEQELRALPIAFPPEPDLVPAVLERLERRRRPRWLVPALVAAAAVGALLAIPQTRAAILDFFRIGGERIERVETQPVAPERAPVTGRRTTLAEARRAVDFPVRVPDPRARVFLDPNVASGMVSFVWDGLVLSEFAGEQIAQKAVGPATEVEFVEVDGVTGAWLEGAPHTVVYFDREGEARELTRRLAGNVLVWTRDGVTYRLEGARSRAVALAEVRNLSPP